VGPKTAKEIDHAVGKRIMMVRQVVGLTQAGLAKRCGLTFEELARYEKGLERVPASVLYLMARELDADIDYFFEGPESSRRPSLTIVPRRPDE
jgi:transcriptional regulator with XRE-family HTH domain